MAKQISPLLLKPLQTCEVMLPSLSPGSLINWTLQDGSWKENI